MVGASSAYAYRAGRWQRDEHGRDAGGLPGDPAYFDILHSYMGYRTCYYRTFAVGSANQEMVDAYKRCRDYLDQAIALIKPGVPTAEVASVWPKAEEFGFPYRGRNGGDQIASWQEKLKQVRSSFELSAPIPA